MHNIFAIVLVVATATMVKGTVCGCDDCKPSVTIPANTWGILYERKTGGATAYKDYYYNITDLRVLSLDGSLLEICIGLLKPSGTAVSCYDHVYNTNCYNMNYSKPFYYASTTAFAYEIVVKCLSTTASCKVTYAAAETVVPKYYWKTGEWSSCTRECLKYRESLCTDTKFGGLTDYQWCVDPLPVNVAYCSEAPCQTTKPATSKCVCHCCDPDYGIPCPTDFVGKPAVGNFTVDSCDDECTEVACAARYPTACPHHVPHGWNKFNEPVCHSGASSIVEKTITGASFLSIITTAVFGLFNL